MNGPLSLPASSLPQAQPNTSVKVETETSDINKRFEQMLWAEMLMHAGLEEALTKNGGEAASSFSRYVVEAIAADIAEQHPLGLGADAKENTAGVQK